MNTASSISSSVHQFCKIVVLPDGAISPHWLDRLEGLPPEPPDWLIFCQSLFPKPFQDSGFPTRLWTLHFRVFLLQDGLLTKVDESYLSKAAGF